MRRQCCATCARKFARFPGGWWCNAVGRHVHDYEVDDYPPCGGARWTPAGDGGMLVSDMEFERAPMFCPRCGERVTDE